MKKLIIKCVLIAAFVYGIVISVNRIADPANISGDDMVIEMAERLLAGEAVASPGDYNEGLLQKLILDEKDPETVILGSSSVMYVPWDYEDYQVVGLSGAYIWDYIAAIGLMDADDSLPERIVICVDPWILKTDHGIGRHDSISEYGQFEAALNAGEDWAQALKILDEKKTDNSWKEYLSFSYFQSSVDYIKKWGLSYALTPAEDRIRSMGEDELDTCPCILPDGRHTDLHVYDPDSIDEEVKGCIERRNLGYLGEDFTELSDQNVILFESLIRYLRGRGVQVDIYLPSIYPLMYEYIDGNDDFKGVGLEEKRIREMAMEYGITVHGTYNPSLSGMEREDYADILHIKPEKGIEEYHFILEQS